MSNLELALHCLAYTLIFVGVVGRVYFSYKANKAREELLRRARKEAP